MPGSDSILSMLGVLTVDSMLTCLLIMCVVHPLQAVLFAPPPIPLMEGGGDSLKVCGFDASERQVFLETLMRHGLQPGSMDIHRTWGPFIPRLPGKTVQQVRLL